MRLIFTVTLAFYFTSCTSESEKFVDEISVVKEKLAQEKAAALNELQQEITAQNVEKLIDLGSWDDAEKFLAQMDAESADRKYVSAKLDMKKHRYEEAEVLVNEILKEQPAHKAAKLLKAELEIQAWRLDNADEIAAGLLSENRNDAQAGFIRGKVAQLQRNYEEALKWAQDIQKWDPEFAEGYLLEAESRFWDQDPEGAEPALKKAIEKNPYNADARYNYGYAIWRRVDATQLDDMAAQWNLALEVNPQHYLTHWHYGNGHTDLTYADYAQPEDDEVREELEAADAYVSSNNLQEAIRITREVEQKYPQSVLPAMMRGSVYYLFYDMDREARLDSAQAEFESVLARKKNYGPAHNAMAAVIKQRQFSYLDEFEELERSIENTEIPAPGSVFYNVFRDSKYYPGDRVYKMISQQIGPSRAYLEMINKFDSNFAIPPLHIDLAIAMNRSFFRTSTTFDNRQWMDIRGVGSGATGIEYLERGSHLERNVLAHEYAHLYHGSILTDAENRKIRSLYYAAMEGGYTLDYYASNNESEYFAQGYAGYLSEKKVHPLNHKSMNTNEYVRTKDPDLYQFLQQMIEKQEAYLAGDKDALADNWAQTYLSLARRTQGTNVNRAMAYLDTALTYNKEYVPAILEYARISAENGDFEKAGRHVDNAEKIAPEFAPVYRREADVLHAKALAGVLSFESSFSEQAALFEKAETLETDFSELASLNITMRQRYFDYAHWADAINAGQQYAENGPEVSTYLRDRKKAAAAFVSDLRSRIGYSEEEIPFMDDLVAQHPQNFGYRLTYADVLLRAEKWDDALDVLEEGQRILSSAGNSMPGYSIRIAQAYANKGDSSKAEEILAEAEAGRLSSQETQLSALVYGQLGDTDKGFELMATIPQPKLPAAVAEAAFITGTLNHLSGDSEEAIALLREALQANPWHLPARQLLIDLLNEKGETREAEEIRSGAFALEIEPGPAFKK